MRVTTENLTKTTVPAHTPTPWIIQGFDRWISAADGETQICDLDTDYQQDYGRNLTKEERTANARLIVNAPQLLATVIDLLRRLEELDPKFYGADDVAEADDLLCAIDGSRA